MSVDAQTHTAWACRQPTCISLQPLPHAALAPQHNKRREEIQKLQTKHPALAERFAVRVGDMDGGIAVTKRSSQHLQEYAMGSPRQSTRRLLYCHLFCTQALKEASMAEGEEEEEESSSTSEVEVSDVKPAVWSNKTDGQFFSSIFASLSGGYLSIILFLSFRV